MTEMDIVGLIGTVGFPIAVCIWLLVERNKQLKALTTAITNLTILIKAKIK